MALTQPQLFKISSFDITKSNINMFKLGMSGADTVSIAQVKIYDNYTEQLVFQDNNVVLQKTSTSTQLSTYSFPQTQFIFSQMQNGKTYYMTVAVATAVAPTQWSPTSNGNVFGCYTTPTFTFNNIQSTTVFAQSNFKILLTYNQSEQEILNSYTVELYKVVGAVETKYQSSPILYDSSYQYSFTNIPAILPTETTTFYRVKASGTTIGGTIFTNTSLDFKVAYQIYANSPLLTLTNVCAEGYVSAKCNIANITGIATPPLVEPFSEADLRWYGAIWSLTSFADIIIGSTPKGMIWSIDGKNWTQNDFNNRIAVSTVLFIKTTANPNGIYVAANGLFGTIWSTDGKNWNIGADTFEWCARHHQMLRPYGVIYGKNIFTSGGLWSEDGKNWQIATMDIALEATDDVLVPILINNIFIGVTRRNGDIAWSNNAKSWNKGTIDGGGWTKVIAGNNIVVAYDKLGRVAWSEDGKNWTLGTGYSNIKIDLLSFFATPLYPNGIFIGYFGSYLANSSFIWSTDGKNWTLWTSAVLDGFGCKLIVYLNNLFIAKGEKGIAWSEDGKNWTLGTGAMGYSTSPDDTIIFFNNVFVTYNSAEGMVWSADGKNWVLTSIVSTNYATSSLCVFKGLLISGNSRAIAGTIGTIWSTDGKNWNIEGKGKGANVLWNDGYSFNPNFTVQYWLRGLAVESSFSIMKNEVANVIEGNDITLNYITAPNDNTKVKLLLMAYIDGTPYPYCLESNAILTPLPTDFLYINVQVANGLYNVYIENTGAVYPPPKI